MRSLSDKIERYCLLHPRFGVQRLMLYIVVGNVLVYLVGMMDTSGTFYGLLYFDPAQFCHGQLWRLFTYPLVPEQNGILWVAIALYFYYFIGSSLEQAWGAGKFTIYYISGVLLTAVYSLLVYLIFRVDVVVSATFVNLSMFFAFATLWPEQRVLLFYIIPVKVKWLAWLDVALYGYDMLRCFVSGRVAAGFVPLVGIGAYLLFCGSWLFDSLRPSSARKKAKVIHFKQAVKKGEQTHSTQTLERRCAVCGKRAAEHPELEFRYCSRCQGYHCFCQEHINNHIHFTE